MGILNKTVNNTSIVFDTTVNFTTVNDMESLKKDVLSLFEGCIGVRDDQGNLSPFTLQTKYHTFIKEAVDRVRGKMDQDPESIDFKLYISSFCESAAFTDKDVTEVVEGFCEFVFTVEALSPIDGQVYDSALHITQPKKDPGALSFIKDLQEVKLLEPIVLTYPLSENRSNAAVEYSLQWNLEYDPIRRGIMEEQESSKPMAFALSKNTDEHMERIKNYLIPSIFSKVSVYQENGELRKLGVNEKLLGPALGLAEKVLNTTVEKLLKFADVEVAKNNPLVQLCFWYGICGEEGAEIDEFFDLDKHAIIGTAALSFYAKVAVATDNEHKVRFLEKEEIDQL